jgi:hypothetical protein
MLLNVVHSSTSCSASSQKPIASSSKTLTCVGSGTVISPLNTASEDHASVSFTPAPDNACKPSLINTSPPLLPDHAIR